MVRPRSPKGTAERRPAAARVEGAIRHRLEGRSKRRGRRSQPTGGNPLNPRVVQALASMDALAEFARAYERGAPIPDTMWKHADVVSEYLGYPPPQQWLCMWLNERGKN